MNQTTLSPRLLSKLFRSEISSNTASSCRYFYATAHYSAKKPARQAPQIRRQQLQERVSNPQVPTSGTRPPSTPPSINDALPAVSPLASGYSSGALPFPPASALHFLREYSRLSASQPPNWEHQLCKDHDIGPQTFYRLSRILSGIPNNASKILGKKLVLSASSLGYASATLHVLSEAVRSGDLSRNEYQAPLRNLRDLARRGNDSARVLLGKVYVKQSRENDALRLFDAVANRKSEGHLEEAPSSATEIVETEEIEKYARFEVIEDFYSVNPVAEALVAKGKLLLQMGNRNDAYEAFQLATANEDYPQAFFEKGMLMEMGKEREDCLTKAASAGMVEAAYNLGISLLGLAIKDASFGVPEKLEMKGRRKWAIEWLLVAAGGGSKDSAMMLETIYTEDGNEIEARRWGDEAGKMKLPN